jgi:membrane fusion protein (multidrug efflux system)
VKRGDLLVRVNTDLLEAQLLGAEGAVDALQAQIEQASAERERAQLEVDRMRPVIEQKAAPQMQMDDAVRDLRVATAVLANRQALLAEKQSELNRLKLMIAKSQVRAPFDGFVARRYVEVGQWIKQGDPVADLVQLDPLYVRAAVPESSAPRIAAGQEVRVTIDALGPDPIVGKVDQVLPEADPLSHTVAVKVLLPNPEARVRPGFLARATFLAQSAENLWLVPKDAVVRDARGARVVAMRGGTAAIVPVRVVDFSGMTATVTGELVDGELVVTRGNEGLRGGEPLMPPRPPPGAPGAGGPPTTSPSASSR